MVCGVCLRGKLKNFIISNVTSFVHGSIHQGDSRFSDISRGKQHASMGLSILIEGDSMYLKGFQENTNSQCLQIKRKTIEITDYY